MFPRERRSSARVDREAGAARVRTELIQTERTDDGPALLVRTDGCVAWAGSTAGGEDGWHHRRVDRKGGAGGQHAVTYDRRMSRPRRRDADATRADILAAARKQFSTDGYERTTMRAVAAAVGVDPALVFRYFGGKQDLFAEAAELTVDLPDLTAVAPEDLAAVLIPCFVTVWEREGTFLALLLPDASRRASVQA